MWPHNHILDLLGIEVPIIQAPMAGWALSDMVVAVSQAGGSVRLLVALLSADRRVRSLMLFVGRHRALSIQASSVTKPPRDDLTREMSWRRRPDGYLPIWALMQWRFSEHQASFLRRQNV